MIVKIWVDAGFDDVIVNVRDGEHSFEFRLPRDKAQDLAVLLLDRASKVGEPHS